MCSADAYMQCAISSPHVVASRSGLVSPQRRHVSTLHRSGRGRAGCRSALPSTHPVRCRCANQVGQRRLPGRSAFPAARHRCRCGRLPFSNGASPNVLWTGVVLIIGYFNISFIFSSLRRLFKLVILSQ